MIRFCDREVICLDADCLTRGQLFTYFFNGHIEDTLFVVDDNGIYKGSITYNSLLNSSDVDGSIQTKAVILDENVWENCRKYFEEYQQLDELILAPVISQKGELVCFAYQDEDANREIRQLRELMECKDALDFRDVFPEYDCVTIIECNELAYLFSKYLMEIGIPVYVCGGFWKDFGREEGRNGAYLDYRNLNIYAEGTWEKYEDLREYMLRSVSVEFEYIDKIYEENIKKGIIQNTTGEFQDLLTKLESVENGKIAIIGVEKESLEVCNLLCKCGLGNICFVSNEFKEEKRFIGGWPVLHEQQVRRMKNIIYLDCNSKYSAYGCSMTDRYDYKGFRRNDRYFCVKDYIDIPQTNLEYILHGKDIILVGDIFLCKRFYTSYVKKFTTINAGYYNIFDDKYVGQEQMEIPFKSREKIKETDIVLIFSYRYLYGDENIKNLDNDNLTTEDYIEKLRSEGFFNYICMYYDIPKHQITEKTKYSDIRLRPRAIVLGALHGDSGTFLVRQMLEHPKIIKMNHGLLNENLVLFCVRLSEENADDIINLFWKFVADAIRKESLYSEFCDIDKFNKKMKELLKYVRRPTSQELFVIFHLAYAAMYNIDITDARDYIIYWERHAVNRLIYPHYTYWLENEEIQGLVITNSRNSLVRAGGLVKYFKNKFGEINVGVLCEILESPEIWDNENSAWETVDIIFEQMKCAPKKSKELIMQVLGLPLTDSKQYVEKKVEYDKIEQIMKPVYNIYDEYFSEFDRLRIAMFTSNWQKKRGYPFVNSREYTRKELQEMILKEFRFEREIVFHSEDEYKKYKYWRNRWLWQRIIAEYYKELNDEVAV